MVRPMSEGSSVVVEDPLLGYSAGGYRIERLLGAGGMGLVYQARHELIDRRFAIKVLRPEVADDEGLAKNFLREAQTLSALKHPNIIDIVGFGPLPDGRQYMVMEFLEGHTLEDELRLGHLSLDRALHVAEQILNALAAAHSVDVIHRDLKPSNVFLALGSGGSETVKLLDFGLAKQQPVALAGLVSVEEGKSVVAGTPEYVAPEQALGHGANSKSDLYSFGVMFFELLTGRLPFVPDSVVIDRVSALLRMHLYDEAPTLEHVGLKVPEQLSSLIRSLLQKKPEDRPASSTVVRDRVAAIRELLKPVSQPLPPPPPVDGRDFDATAIIDARSKRRTTGAIVALVILILLLAGSFVFIGESRPPAQVDVSTMPVDVTTKPAELEELERLRTIEAARRKEAAATPPPPEVLPVEKPNLDAAPPEPKLTVKAPRPKTVMSLDKSDCEPDDRWRAAAKSHLEELQGLAADVGGAPWEAFQRLEPKLTRAIDEASTGAQCEAVESQIRRLATARQK